MLEVGRLDDVQPGEGEFCFSLVIIAALSEVADDKVGEDGENERDENAVEGIQFFAEQNFQLA